MSDALKIPARIIANTLPIYRGYRGYKTAQELATTMRDPRDRTWDFTKRVAFDALTDTIDGRLARYAGTTAMGGYLDQIGDKAWFLQIAQQLVKNDEISLSNYKLPLARDIGTLAIRPVAQRFGISPDAHTLGKLKMELQVAAVVAACSPIAAEAPGIVHDMFKLATAASVASGGELAVSYIQDVRQRTSNQLDLLAA